MSTMQSMRAADRPHHNWLVQIIMGIIALLNWIPQSIVSLAARIFPAVIFWSSGETKAQILPDQCGASLFQGFDKIGAQLGDCANAFVKGVPDWHLSPSAVELFKQEYKLPVIDPAIAAHLAAFAEHFFPFLLIIGFASRFAALALLGMTAVIEIFVYPDSWPLHGVWATCFLVVIARGPGVFSLDYLMGLLFGVRTRR
jgi:putative oxidoreductase